MIKVEKGEENVKVEMKGNYSTLMVELEALKEAIIKFKEETEKHKNGKV